MAARKKTAKAKAKRKKVRAGKPAPRVKRAAAKTKKAAKKKIARRPARAVPKAAAPRAKPPSAPERAAKPPAAAPAPAAKPAPAEERIGVVSHYFSHISVAALLMESGTLRVGDTIHVKGHTTDFTQRVDSLQVDHAPVSEVRSGQDFGVKVREHAREHDVVYKVTAR